MVEVRKDFWGVSLVQPPAQAKQKQREKSGKFCYA